MGLMIKRQRAWIATRREPATPMLFLSEKRGNLYRDIRLVAGGHGENEWCPMTN